MAEMAINAIYGVISDLENHNNNYLKFDKKMIK